MLGTNVIAVRGGRTSTSSGRKSGVELIAQFLLPDADDPLLPSPLELREAEEPTLVPPDSRTAP